MQYADYARYARQLVLPGFGPQAQQKLAQARVLVVGAGGLGCPLLQYLAAAGVGTIGIADGDVVDASNLHRQILYGDADVGKPKAQTARQKLLAQNPHVQVNTHAEHLTQANALAIIGGYDLVADGSDNFATRYLVNDACVLLGKPLVHGSVYQYEGQLAVFNHPAGSGPNYRCLYPTPPAADSMPNCAEAGVLGVLPGIIGAMMAQECIKLVTGIGDTLAGRWLVYDGLTGTQRTYAVTRDPHNVLFKAGFDFAAQDYADTTCALPSELEVSADAFAQLRMQGAWVIDVREPWEHAEANIGGRNVPLTQIDSIAQDVNGPVVLYCKSGARSAAAAHRLRLLTGRTDVVSLRGGLLQYNAVKMQ
jgi:adenylyltransferase/sulfurtransferase